MDDVSLERRERRERHGGVFAELEVSLASPRQDLQDSTVVARRYTVVSKQQLNLDPEAFLARAGLGDAASSARPDVGPPDDQGGGQESPIRELDLETR